VARLPNCFLHQLCSTDKLERLSLAKYFKANLVFEGDWYSLPETKAVACVWILWDEANQFHNLTATSGKVTKLFSSSIMLNTDKLERLSLAKYFKANLVFEGDWYSLP
jgi:hypothetical protein